MRCNKYILKKLISFVLFLFLVISCNLLFYKIFVGHRYKWIVIHHTASDYGNYASIKKYHAKEHNWLDAAYHLILSNGSTEVPAGFLEATKRYRFLSYSLGTQSPKHNIWGLHLCIVGNYEDRPLPENLKKALAFSIASLQEKFSIPNTHILFHRDVGSTLCPGKYITKQAIFSWMALADKCRPNIQKQQANVISNAKFSLHTIPDAYILIVLVFSAFIFLLFLGLYAIFSKKKGNKRISRGSIFVGFIFKKGLCASRQDPVSSRTVSQAKDMGWKKCRNKIEKSKEEFLKDDIPFQKRT